jgi:predicted porin
MQKKIIALAIAAAFAAPVVAMADVTVYGVVDGNFRSSTTAGVTSNSMNSGAGLNSNRWGVKSSEDLGDGMKANVVLEGDLYTATGVNSASGATPGALFSRQSTVGLEGGFGKVDLGHQYTVAFKMNTLIDPFSHQFIGLTYANKASGVTLGTPTANITRNDSDISYTGKFGDITVMADKTMGAATSDSGATAAAGVSFVGGPITAVVSYTKIKAAASPTLISTDVTHIQAGAGFNFGDGSVKIGYAQQKNADSSASGASSVGNDVTTTNIWLGGNFNISSKIGVTAAYYKNTLAVTAANDVVTTNVVAAVTYALSKKTAMYVEADKQTNDSTNNDSNGYTVGMNVAF